MRSGKHISVRVNLNEYSDLHRVQNCTGEFHVRHITGAVMDSSVLGPIKLPLMPMLVCSKCGASFVMPEFETWVESMVAHHLVAQNGFLSKKQIRFLRQHFELTQDQVAKMIGASDRHEIAKMESLSNDRSMEADRQLRLRLHYAKMLELENLEEIFALATPLEAAIEIDQSWFPEDEIKRKFSA